MRPISFIFALFIFLISCKDTAPQPSAFVGKYVVTARLEEKAIDGKVIQDSISNALKNVGSELEKAKQELNQDFDLSSIDTTSLEGKLEYAAKSMGSAIGNSSLDIGKLSGDLGGLLGNLAKSGIDFSEKMLKNLKIEVELQADGDIRAENKFVNFGLDDAKWRVEGDTFILSQKDGKEEQRYAIINKSNNNFTIEKDKLLLEFTRMENKN